MRSVNVVMTIDPLFTSNTTALCQGDTLWTVCNISVIPLCRSIGKTVNLLTPLILGVDGNWSSWGKPGPCDKTCGRGVRKIKRTCTNPPPSGDGKKCRGLSTKTESCNTQQCKLVLELYLLSMRTKLSLVVGWYNPRHSPTCNVFFSKPAKVKIFSNLVHLVSIINKKSKIHPGLHSVREMPT